MKLTNSVKLEQDVGGEHYSNIKYLKTWLECTSYCWSVVGTNSVYRFSKFNFAVKLTQSVRTATRLTSDLARRGNFKLYYEAKGDCTNTLYNSSISNENLTNDYVYGDSWMNDNLYNDTSVFYSD